MAQTAWNESVMPAPAEGSALPAGHAVPGRCRRQRVMAGRLLEGAIVRLGLAALLLMAAGYRLLGWPAALGLLATLPMMQGLLAAVARRSMARRYDTALLGPELLMGLLLLVLAAWAGHAGERMVLVAALLPAVVRSVVHVRGPVWAGLATGAVLCGSAALLAWAGTASRPLDLVWLLSGLLCAAPLLLVVPGRLRGLRARAAADWVLSADPQQRIYIVRFLIGAVNASAGLVALNVGVAFDVVDAGHAAWLTALGLMTMAGLYALLRSGLNRRLSDPSISELQLLLTIAFLAVGYCLGGLGRGVSLMLLVTVQMFGMYVITPAQVMRTSLFAALSFGAAMLAVGSGAIDNQQVRLQGVYYAVLLVILASMSWMALQFARLRQALEHRTVELGQALDRIRVLASHDELTGLPNRRHMLDMLKLQARRSSRSGGSFCLAVVDVDHFKRVNDTHGHGVGDEALRAFAQALQAALRETDVLGRWGGEEFLLILPDSTLEAAHLTLERARLAVARTSLCRSVPELVLTFSCGVTECRAGEPIEQAVERADQALYAAKASGRNRAFMVPGPLPAEPGGGATGLPPRHERAA